MEFRGCAQIGRRLGCLILHNLWAACEGSLSMSMLDQHCWYCAFNNFRNFKVVCSRLEWCKFLCYWWQLAAKCITCTSSNLMIWLPFGDHLNPITTWFVVSISFKHWGNMVFLSLSLSLLTLSLLLILLLYDGVVLLLSKYFPPTRCIFCGWTQTWCGGCSDFKFNSQIFMFQRSAGIQEEIFQYS